eukprot:753399-Hanusia_phi.AAC.3
MSFLIFAASIAYHISSFFLVGGKISMKPSLSASIMPNIPQHEAELGADLQSQLSAPEQFRLSAL